MLSLHSARVRDCTVREIDQQLYQHKRFIRIRAMRGSMFLVPDCHIRTVLQATKPTSERIVEQFQKWILKSGITQKELSRVLDEVETIVARSGARTADELRTMSTMAKKRDAVRRTFSYILQILCEQERLVRGKVRGGWRSNLYEYNLFEHWLPNLKKGPASAAQAEPEFARLYFQAFGPASEEDFRWWSGFSKQQSTRAMESLKSDLIPLTIREVPGPYWLPANELQTLQSSEPIRSVSLLPVWDAYLMAYRQRERIVDSQQYDYVYDRGGNSTSVILKDGRVAGLWQAEDQPGGKMVVRAAFFKPPARTVWKLVEKAASRIALAAGFKQLQLIQAELPPKITLGSQNHFLNRFGKG